MEIYAREVVANGAREFLTMDKGMLMRERIEEGTKGAKPLLVLGLSEFDELIKTLAKHAKVQGIKTTDESTALGKLEATTKHINDLRFITKALLKKRR